jgi:hypothetical protein
MEPPHRKAKTVERSAVRAGRSAKSPAAAAGKPIPFPAGSPEPTDRLCGANTINTHFNKRLPVLMLHRNMTGVCLWYPRDGA